MGATLRVNVTAPMWLSRAAIPHMRAAGHGSIINISSRQGERPSAGLAAYAASKGALERADARDRRRGSASTGSAATRSARAMCSTSGATPTWAESDARGSRRCTSRGSARRATSRTPPCTSRAASRSSSPGSTSSSTAAGASPAPRRSGKRRAPACLAVGDLDVRVDLDEDLAFYERAGITAIGASLAKLEAGGRRRRARAPARRGPARHQPHRPRPVPPRRPDAVGRQRDRVYALRSTPPRPSDAECMILTTGPAGS